MLRSPIWFAFGSVAVLAAACAGRHPAPETTVIGSVALSTYRSAPQAIVATNEAGVAIRAPLAADGAFKVTLAKGHKYRFAVATATGSVPFVFPRTGGTLDAAFRVRSNGGAVQLGQVKYLASAPPTGFKVMATHPPAPAPGSGADCTDCADDDHEVSCSDGSHGHDDGEASSAEADDHADANQEMSVAEHNAPDDVAGCDDEAEGENNNEH